MSDTKREDMTEAEVEAALQAHRKKIAAQGGPLIPDDYPAEDPAAEALAAYFEKHSAELKRTSGM